jgi:hypothetical protein
MLLYPVCCEIVSYLHHISYPEIVYTSTSRGIFVAIIEIIIWILIGASLKEKVE